MAGIGGAAFQARHVEATAEALASMSLGPGDLVYVSAFQPPPSGLHAERAIQAGIGRLGAEETECQVELLIEAARRSTGGRVRVARYDIAEFIY